MNAYWRIIVHNAIIFSAYKISREGAGIFDPQAERRVATVGSVTRIKMNSTFLVLSSMPITRFSWRSGLFCKACNKELQLITYDGKMNPFLGKFITIYYCTTSHKYGSVSYLIHCGLCDKLNMCDDRIWQELITSVKIHMLDIHNVHSNDSSIVSVGDKSVLLKIGEYKIWMPTFISIYMQPNYNGIMKLITSSDEDTESSRRLII